MVEQQLRVMERLTPCDGRGRGAAGYDERSGVRDEEAVRLMCWPAEINCLLPVRRWSSFEPQPPCSSWVEVRWLDVLFLGLFVLREYQSIIVLLSSEVREDKNYRMGIFNESDQPCPSTAVT